ncbi:MAG TPA: sigma 54-interacting transcriptional regulator [bacterium]
MNIHALEFLISSIGILCICVFIYLKNSQRIENRKLVAFLFSLAMWQLANFSIITSPDEGSALIISKILRFGLLFVYSTFFDFTLSITGQRERHKLPLLLAYLSSVSLYILNWFPVFTPGVLRYEYGYYLKSGSLYPIFIVLLLGYIFYSLYLMVKSMKIDATIRNKIKFIFFGSAIGILGNIINILPMYGISIYPLGTLMLIIYVMILTYAVIQNRIIEVELAVTRGMIYSGALIIFVSAFTFLLYLESYFLPGIDTRILAMADFFLLYLPSYFFLAKTLPKTEVTINLKLSKKYRLQHNLNKILQNITEFTDIKNFLKTLSYAVGTGFTCIFKNGGEYFETVTPEGVKLNFLSEHKEYSTILRELEKEKEPIVVNDKPGDTNVHAELNKLNTYAVIPLMNKGEIVGMLTLDKSLSHKFFSKTDFEILMDVAEKVAEIQKRELKTNSRVEKMETELKKTKEHLFFESERQQEQSRVYMNIIKAQEDIIEHLKNSIIHQTNNITAQKNQGSSPVIIDESAVIAESQQMQGILLKLQRVALLEFPILITGGQGSGKLHIAKYIHHISNKKKLKIINCANLEDKNIEFILAENVDANANDSSMLTVILQNIDLLDSSSQLALFKIIETGSLRSQNGAGIIFKPRYISTSKRNLDSLSNQGVFNKSLYNAINVFSYYIPSLRDRKEDIPVLTEYFLDIFNLKYNMNVSPTQDYRSALTERMWQGNVLELKMEIEKLVSGSQSKTTPQKFIFISPATSDRLAPGATEILKTENLLNETNLSLKDLLYKVEREVIITALKKTKKQKDAAKLLGVPASTLNEKIKKLGIEEG